MEAKTVKRFFFCFFRLKFKFAGVATEIKKKKWEHQTSYETFLIEFSEILSPASFRHDDDVTRRSDSRAALTDRNRTRQTSSPTCRMMMQAGDLLIIICYRTLLRTWPGNVGFRLNAQKSFSWVRWLQAKSNKKITRDLVSKNAISIKRSPCQLWYFNGIINAHQYPIQFPPLLKCAQVGICLQSANGSVGLS